MSANAYRLLALLMLAVVAGHFDMKDDEARDAAAAEDSRAAMVQRAAEDACAGQVVTTARGLRCAERDATGTMVARLMETRP